MQREPRFDIFSGDMDKDAVWVEAVEGLANAHEQMEQIASRVPGRYFLFSSYSHSVLGRIDTTQRVVASDVRGEKRSA